MESVREVFYYGNYYLSFFERQNKIVQKKLNWVIGVVSTTQRIPVIFFKHITGTDGLYEIRVESGGNIFRIFCFFEIENKLILLNAFQKKENKTPRNQIALAKKLKNEYEEEKNK